MPLFKSKSNTVKKHDDRSNGGRKKVKYVWVSSRKAIFIIAGEPRESKCSYGIPIIPLHGYYRSKGKSYTAKELCDYYVVLNLPKEADISQLKGKRVVILGYDQDVLYIANDNDEDEGEGGEKK